MRPLIVLGLLLLGPQSAADLRDRAQGKEKAGDLDGAIADYTRAIDLDPKATATISLRGLAKKSAGDLRGAVLDFSRVLELSPQDPDAFAHRGAVRADLRLYGDAIQDFTRAIEISPDNSHLYHFRGCAFYDARFFASAATDFRKAVELEKGSWEFPHLRLWLARTKVGDRGDATQELIKHLARREAPPGTDYLGQAERFLTGALTAQAFIDWVESDLSEGASRWRCQAYFLLGEYTWLEGDKPGAAKYFEKALATKATAWRDFPSAQVALEALRGAQK